MARRMRGWENRGRRGPAAGEEAAALAGLGLRLLLLVGGIRGLAGDLDRVVDPAEPFVGLHEPWARLLRVRRGRGARRGHAAATLCGGCMRVARRAVRLGSG